MDHAKAKKIFDALYENIDGRGLSMEGREAQSLTSKSFVYGEALFDPFCELLKEAEPKPGQVIVDCGSGTGKPSFIAYLMFDFSKSVGVELVDTLYNASMSVLERFEREFKPEIADELGDRQIRFINGDMLDIDFSTVDIVWLPSTCYQEDLMLALEEPFTALKPNSQVITLSKTLAFPGFDMYKQKTFPFSWGPGTAFYHRKIK